MVLVACQLVSDYEVGAHSHTFRSFFFRPLLGSFLFPLLVILDIYPLFTTFIILVGWLAKTAVATLLSSWVGGDESTGEAWLAYSVVIGRNFGIIISRSIVHMPKSLTIHQNFKRTSRPMLSFSSIVTCVFNYIGIWKRSCPSCLPSIVFTSESEKSRQSIDSQPYYCRYIRCKPAI